MGDDGMDGDSPTSYSHRDSCEELMTVVLTSTRTQMFNKY
jgi:hypothetical protein